MDPSCPVSLTLSTADYTDSTYEELYHSRLNTVAEWCYLLGTQLVVVSSWREAHGDPVYPTPPPSITWTRQTPELAAWYKNVLFAWDPCMLRIGTFVLGISSPDVLFQLSSEEISAQYVDKNKDDRFLSR
ncbi:unnamed protein product [Dibothriocephalus latus]|uniref:DNA polymerase alpha subunit B n=1 Tax=Dibothriocephalus latus TaxID=60516 RepID=A0A3P7RC52_DIBLA|nr:unnamed protein product [Dibothriocephalus latus]